MWLLLLLDLTFHLGGVFDWLYVLKVSDVFADFIFVAQESRVFEFRNFYSCLLRFL